MVQTNALKLSPSQPVQSHPEAQTAASFTSSQTTVGFPVAHPHTGYTTSRDFILRRELSASAMHALGDQHSSASSPHHHGMFISPTGAYGHAEGGAHPLFSGLHEQAAPGAHHHHHHHHALNGQMRLGLPGDIYGRPEHFGHRPEHYGSSSLHSYKLHELKCEPRHSSSRSHGGVFCDTCGSPSSKSSSASGLTRSRRPRSPAPKLSAPCTSSSTMSRWSTSGDRSRAVTSASGKSVRARERRLKPSTN